MTAEPDIAAARAGRRAALLMAGTALFWIATTFAGSQFGLSNRTLALFDLMALAGFGMALWMTYQVWRLRRNHKE